jgi:nitrous oxidase accessory protein NosD
VRRAQLATLATLPLTLFVLAGWCLAMIGTATPASAAYLCTSDYGSIQAAINAAGDGDTVRIVRGLYTETLVINRNITLQGGHPSDCVNKPILNPANTVIDGGAAGSVVSIGGGSTATLDALTLTNGQSDEGGGVYVSGASPTLHNVVVTGNVISPTVTGGSTTPTAAGCLCAMAPSH